MTRWKWEKEINRTILESHSSAHCKSLRSIIPEITPGMTSNKRCTLHPSSSLYSPLHLNGRIYNITFELGVSRRFTVIANWDPFDSSTINFSIARAKMILPRVMSLHCVSQCALIWIIANALRFRNASITNINNRGRTPPQFTTKVLFLGDITRWRRLSCLFSIPCSLYYYSVNCLGAQCHCQ